MIIEYFKDKPQQELSHFWIIELNNMIVKECFNSNDWKEIADTFVEYEE